MSTAASEDNVLQGLRSPPCVITPWVTVRVMPPSCCQSAGARLHFLCNRWTNGATQTNPKPGEPNVQKTPSSRTFTNYLIGASWCFILKHIHTIYETWMNEWRKYTYINKLQTWDLHTNFCQLYTWFDVSGKNSLFFLLCLRLLPYYLCNTDLYEAAGGRSDKKERHSASLFTAFHLYVLQL